VCCSVLQCVAVCCSVLQCVSVWYRILQCVAVCCNVLLSVAVCCHVLQCVLVVSQQSALLLFYLKADCCDTSATHCCTTLQQYIALPRTATNWLLTNSLRESSEVFTKLLLTTATCCNTLHHTASLCTSLQRIVPRCNTLQHCCVTLQHTTLREILSRESSEEVAKSDPL